MQHAHNNHSECCTYAANLNDDADRDTLFLYKQLQRERLMERDDTFC